MNSSQTDSFDLLGIIGDQQQIIASSVPDIFQFDPLASTDFDSFCESALRSRFSSRKKARSIEIEVKPVTKLPEMSQNVFHSHHNTISSNIKGMAGLDFDISNFSSQHQQCSDQRATSTKNYSKRCSVECSVSPLAQENQSNAKKNSIVAGRFTISKDNPENSNISRSQPHSSKFKIDVHIPQSSSPKQNGDLIFPDSLIEKNQMQDRNLDLIYEQLLSF
jgi:hypothetical protein